MYVAVFDAPVIYITDIKLFVKECNANKANFPVWYRLID